MGLLDGNSGGLNERMADVLVNVFDKYDIEPGELNAKMEDTIEMVEGLEPFLKLLENRSQNLGSDIEDVRDDIDELKQSSDEFSTSAKGLAEEIHELNETFEQFRQMVEEAENNG